MILYTNKYRALRLTALLIFCAAFSYGQSKPGPTKKISAELLRADLRFLREKLESSQPGLYLYITKDSLDAVFDNIYSSFTDSLTSIEFFRRIAPLNGILRNLHTRFWPSAADERASEIDSSRLPVDIYWHAGKMYVLRNHSSDDRIVPGAMIKTINGEDAATLFKKILACRVRDGHNETYPVAQATRNFGVYYAQLVGIAKTFTLEVISPNGLNLETKIQGLTGLELDKSRAERYHRKFSQYCEDWDAWIRNNEPALRFEIKENFAIMKVHTFYLPIIEGNGQQYEEFFKDSFGQLKRNNIKHLIIDLRNNHGGTDPVGMSLLSHLHDSVLYYYKRRSAFVRPNAKHIKKGGVYEIIGRGVWTGKVTPAREIYDGKVYVLMNGYSVSAAGEFIGHLKNINRATFIGEEAGGNPVRFTGGESLPVDLPYTHITGTIPLHEVEMNVSLINTAHGVIPDYEVRPDIDDVLEGRDLELERALELISRKN